MKENSSHNHHYIPQCYLKGFTEFDKKESKIICLDLKDIKSFPTSIRNIGSKRDFNTIESKNYFSDSLENALSGFESALTNAFNNIKNTYNFAGREKTFILNLIALLAVRNPHKRDYWNKMREYSTKIILKTAAQQPIGTIVNGYQITQEFKDIVNNDSFQIRIKDKPFKAEFKTVDYIGCSFNFSGGNFINQ